MSLENITALLPMKGHSERVPGKNIRSFAGKPLFRWVLDTLILSDHIDEVIINTDSDVIAEQASKLPKVKIVMRPEHLLGDMVPMNDIILHDVAHAKNKHILQTHATNPLLTKHTLDAAIALYFSSLASYDSLFSVTQWQCRFFDKAGTPVNHDPKILLRTQDLPPLYEENSCIYIFSGESFKCAGNKRIGTKPQMFPMSKIEAVDIDEEDDFSLAEALARRSALSN